MSLRHKIIQSKIVRLVFIIQLALGLFEVINVLTSTESWPFFFMFVINSPASLLAFRLAGLMGNPSLFFTFVVMVTFGTAWWSAIIYAIYWLFQKIRKIGKQ